VRKPLQPEFEQARRPVKTRHEAVYERYGRSFRMESRALGYNTQQSPIPPMVIRPQTKLRLSISEGNNF